MPSAIIPGESVRVCLLATLVCLVLPAVLLHAQQQTALDRYVAQPDESYRWKIVHRHQVPGLTTYVVDMTSQTWRTPQEVNRTQWQHWLVVSCPDNVSTDTALLFITGGKNGGDPPTGPDERQVSLAQASRSVVATLRMVPNQPLVFHADGQPRTEDDLVAYTWIQFLKTGDPTWPARNPMVKSAVRAMDTVTAVMAQEQAGRARVNRYVVAGGSKRGWTTWLTAAVDARVVAIIPIVIDVLNVEKSMRHHYAAYGFWAPAVGDYEEQRVFQYMGTPRMEQLLQLVDPYRYRERLTLPKFILNAAGDQFFLPDSSQFYFADLRGDKYLRYVPNADHSLDGSDAVQSLLAFYLTVLRDKPRPAIQWSFEAEGVIRVTSDTPPAQVTLWQATNPAARDFRLETLGPRYTRTELPAHADGSFVARVPAPDAGWTAFFVELTYDIGEAVPLKLTTAVRVLPDTLPYQHLDPLQPAQ